MIVAKQVLFLCQGKTFPFLCSFRYPDFLARRENCSVKNEKWIAFLESRYFNSNPFCLFFNILSQNFTENQNNIIVASGQRFSNPKNDLNLFNL